MCCVLSHFSRVQLFVILWTLTHQAPLSMGFSRQEYWSELQFPSAGDLTDPGIEPTSLTFHALAGWFFIASATWKGLEPHVSQKEAKRDLAYTHVCTHTYTHQGAVWPQRQSGVLWLPAKECQQPSHTGRNRDRISPAECEGQGHGFSPVKLRINFCCLKATQFVAVCYSSSRSWLRSCQIAPSTESQSKMPSPQRFCWTTPSLSLKGSGIS